MSVKYKSNIWTRKQYLSREYISNYIWLRHIFMIADETT